MPALRFTAPVRSSAARAALRGTSPLPHLFRASHSCEATSVRLVCSIRYRRVRHCISSISSHTPRLQTWRRSNWPKTDVGAGLSREAPRGRRSISQALEPSRQAPGRPDAISCKARLTAAPGTQPGRCPVSPASAHSLCHPPGRYRPGHPARPGAPAALLSGSRPAAAAAVVR